ncbi:MAG: hypothetical protein PXX77_04450, partial [Gallionella sp.]|nr:hypothetical protein [Gallionella sp.]
GTNGMWTWATATKGANGVWTFDATKFADGTLSAYAQVVDAAGNYAYNNFSLTKSAGAGGATVTTLDGNTTVNAAEAGLATVLNVTPNNAGDTIQSVAVHGSNQQTGAPMSVNAMAGAAPGTWTFDATGFNGNGQLTVDVTVASGVNTAVSSRTLTMNAWSFWTDNTYFDLMLGSGQVGTGTATVHAAQLPVGQVLSQVTVSGLDAVGNPVVVVAQPGAAGTWSFDTTGFADNIGLSLNGTVVDAATGNRINGAGGSLFLSSASTANNPFPATIVTSWNGSSFINQGELYNTAFQVVYGGGTMVSSVTVSDGANQQVLPVINGMAIGFNALLFNQGVLTVTTDTGVMVHLYKDTVAPTGVFNVTSGGDYVVGLTDIVGTIATISVAPALAAGEHIQSLWVMGADANGTIVGSQAVQDMSGNWTFDTAQFVQGSRLVVSVNVVDAAGNWGNNMGPENQLILNKTGGFVVPQINVGGDVGINQYELTTFNPANPANPILGTTIDLSQIAGGVSNVSISGLSAAGGNITIDSATGGVQLGAGTAMFDATQFSSNQYLSVSVNGGATLGNLGLDTQAPENWAAPTQVAAGGVTQFDANLMFWDPIAVGNAPLATLIVDQSTNLTASMSGSMVTVAPTAGATGYGWLTLAGMDQAGNFNTVDVQVAIFNPLNLFDTSITPNQITDVTGSTDARFRDGTSTSNDVFLVGANSNVLINAGGGNDVVVLSDAVLNNFSAIRGGAMDVTATVAGTDTVQLTSTFSTLNLGQFNNFGQQVLFNFEKIDMATDAGANTVTLGARDLFLMYSETVDVLTGSMALAINGGTNDIVNCGLNTAAGFTQVAGSYDAAGNAGVGYGKYTGTYTDFGNNNYLVELLIQNGVQVV